MKIRTQKSWRCVLFSCALTLLPCAAHSEDYPYPLVLAVWEEWWGKAVQEQIDPLVEAYDNKDLASLSSDERTAFLNEFRKLFEDALSWDGFGRAKIIKYLDASCGDALLSELEPVFAEKSEDDEIDEHLRTGYRACVADVMYFAETSVTMQYMETGREELSPLLRRHGVSSK